MKPWITPYKIREMEVTKLKLFLDAAFGNSGWYEVLFEDSPILINLSRDNAETICGALNGAYNLGRNELPHRLYRDENSNMTITEE